MMEHSRFVLWFVLISLVSGSASANCCTDAETSHTTSVIPSADLKKFVNDIVTDLMQAEHIPGTAIVLVQNGKVVLSQGFGYANLEERKPVHTDKTIFPIGSISKVFTATALMQLTDRKSIELKSDVNLYLKKLKVPDTFSGPITASHLLSHTSGLDEIRPGTQARSADEILPLHEFLKGRIDRVHPAGRVTSYSTYGITLAGLLIEETSGVSYETYMAENIWKPLNMNRTHISTPAHFAPDVAVGYAVENSKPEKAAYEWYHTTPASSIRSTAQDMGNFILAHLQCGEYLGRRILSKQAACEMHRTQSTTHPQMPGWTYGFQEDDTNGLRILEHGGDIAGFGSLIVLLPDQNTGFFIVHHLEGGTLRFALKQKLLDRYFPDKRSVQVPVPTPDLTGQLKRFVGLYRGNLFCHTCKNPLPVAEVEVTSNQNGTITVWEDQWVQIGPLLFLRLDGKKKIGFQEDKTGRILQMSSGSWKVLEKVK